MKLSPGSSSSASPKNLLSNFSPAGLHVLVVDDDPLCLMVLERMLKQCSYKVTTCNRVSRALHLLRENKEHVDLVLSDVYMPDEDGFKLLEVIGLELDLPVIMMSANGETSVVMQGITHGACDYLIKPVRMEELRNIWQHVVRRKRKDLALKAELQGESDDSPRVAESQLEQSSKKRKEKESMIEMVDCNIDDINSLKKARVNWSVQLHQQFVNAVNQLGVEKAVPKKILEIMNVQGLTRENVASHLQKYRLYLKRLSGVVPEPYPIASFQASGDGTTGGTMLVQQASSVPKSSNTVKGLNLGAGVGTGAARLRKIDPSTMQSLVQYKSYEQKQAANRAQVLGALGVADQRPVAGGGLQRMTSLDLSFFLQAQHIDAASKAQQKRFGQPLGAVGVVDDMAVRGVKVEEGEVQAPKLRKGKTTPTAAVASSSHWEDANWRQHSRPTVVVPEDAVSSNNDQQDLSGSAQEVSGGSTGAGLSTDTFSDCSLDALGDLTHGVDLATSLQHNNELDISDYLQFEEGFTYQN